MCNRGFMQHVYMYKFDADPYLARLKECTDIIHCERFGRAAAGTDGFCVHFCVCVDVAELNPGAAAARSLALDGIACR